MRRPSLLLVLPVLLSGCAVAPDPSAEVNDLRALSAQDYFDSYEGAADLGPSEISPDEELLCTEDGDRHEECTREAELRWALPLEGEYRVRADSSSPALYHVETGAHGMEEDVEPTPGGFSAVEASGGTIVFAQNAQVRGIDAETGEALWSVDLGQELDGDDPGFLHTGLTGVHSFAGGLLAAYDRGMVVMDPQDGTVKSVTGASYSLGEVEHVRGDLVLTERVEEEGGSYLSTVDLSEGEVVWEGPFPGANTRNAGVHGHHLYVVWNDSGDNSFVDQYSPEGWLARMDIRDGELEYLIEEDAEGLRDTSRFSALHPDGSIVLEQPGEGYYAYDYAAEEVLWEAAEFERSTPVDTPSGAAFETAEGEIIDAETGDLLPEETPTEPPASDTDASDPLKTFRQRNTVVTSLEGVAGAPDGVGTLGLTRTDALTVALACAPDGLRETAPESPSPGVLCERPRLYAVNAVD